MAWHGSGQGRGPACPPCPLRPALLPSCPAQASPGLAQRWVQRSEGAAGPSDGIVGARCFCARRRWESENSMALRASLKTGRTPLGGGPPLSVRSVCPPWEWESSAGFRVRRPLAVAISRCGWEPSDCSGSPGVSSSLPSPAVLLCT